MFIFLRVQIKAVEANHRQLAKQIANLSDIIFYQILKLIEIV